MNTFLKILLLVGLALLAVKLLPLTLAVGCGLAAALVVIALLGVSLISIVGCIGIGLAVLLSPVWLPILALLGIIALVKRTNRPVGV